MTDKSSKQPGVCGPRIIVEWDSDSRELTARLPLGEKGNGNYLSRKEHEHLLAEAKAAVIQQCKDRIYEKAERQKRMRFINPKHIEGLEQAWGLIHELPEYLAKAVGEKERDENA